MLLKLELENFLSFKDRQIFSLVADYNRSEIFNDNILGKIPSIATHKNQYILNGGIIYGSNAGGKTNFIVGVGVLKNLVTSSENDHILKNNFGFHFSDRFKPSILNIELIKEIEEEKYFINYQLEFVKNKISKERISYRDVLKTKLSEEKVIFEREGQRITTFDLSLKPIINYFEPRNFIDETLMYNFVNKINYEFFEESITGKAYQILKACYDYIDKDIIILDDEFDKSYIAENLKHDESLKDQILAALDDIDIKIDDFDIVDTTEQEIENFLADIEGDIPDELKESFINRRRKNRSYTIKTLRTIEGVSYSLDLRQESLGTIKFIHEFIQIFDCLTNHKLYIVDEIENHYHPMIQRYTLDLFLNQSDTKAQFIFTTHNTDFLEMNNMSKEQIWFIQKDNQLLQSELYSLAEFQDVSYQNHNWRNMYNEGRLGAIPKVIY